MWPTIPPETPAWLYLLCVGGAVLVLGIAKAGFGGGVGVLAVPLMAVAVPTDRTIGVMLPVLLSADVLSVWVHHRRVSKTHLGWLVGGAAVGIAAGTGLLWWLRESTRFNQGLNLTVGGTCLALVAVQVYRLARLRLPRVPGTPLAGRVTGAVSGAVSTLTHGAGPVVSVYLLEQRLDKARLVATAAVAFMAINTMKLPTYFGMGLIDRGTLWASLWCVPLVPVGVAMGVWLHRRIAERPFAVVMYVGAALAAARMIYRGLAG